MGEGSEMVEVRREEHNRGKISRDPRPATRGRQGDVGRELLVAEVATHSCIPCIANQQSLN